MDKLYRIKPLVWWKNDAAQITSDSIIGQYIITSVRSFPRVYLWYGKNVDSVCGKTESLDDAKSIAEAHYRARLAECLEEVE